MIEFLCLLIFIGFISLMFRSDRSDLDFKRQALMRSYGFTKDSDGNIRDKNGNVLGPAPKY